MDQSWRKSPRPRPSLAAIAVAAALLFGLAPLVGCGSSDASHGAHGEATAAGTFLCPMHTDFVRDAPGDCQICGMKLVAADRKSTRGPGASGLSSAYVCPMHPEVKAEKPDRCPKCGMDLEPLPGTPTQIPTHASVELDAETLHLAGVRTAAATHSNLAHRIRTTGTVSVDLSRIASVVIRYAGFLRKLHVTYSGAQVRKGDPLVTIDSAESQAAQDEYIRFIRAVQGDKRFPVAVPEAGNRYRPEDLAISARDRIERTGLPESLLRDLESNRVSQYSVTYPSPLDGFVTLADAVEGQAIEPGFRVMNVTDLSEVWVEADIYESESTLVRPGQTATISIPAADATTLTGKIVNVSPFVDPTTRTLKARVRVPNRGLLLKQGMFVDVVVDAGQSDTLTIPSSAILDTGRRKLVYVETSPGNFMPRMIETGPSADGMTAVRSGLMHGERVATHGNFLLDSESRLKASLQR